jgi:hypothetical protein
VTAGRHLRQARERCREIGLDFNKWCAQANLGIKRSRIYQLMGPDPITSERRDENYTVEPENVQSVDIAQLSDVERLIQPGEEERPDPAVEASDKPAEHDPLFGPPFAYALAQFEAWFAGLTITQQQAVIDVVTRVDSRHIGDHADALARRALLDIATAPDSDVVPLVTAR